MAEWTSKHDYYLDKVILPIQNRLEQFMVGQRRVISGVVKGLFAVGQRDFDDQGKKVLGVGHVLTIGPAGTGKTILCRLMSAILAGSNGRIQCVSDLLASDITGCEIILLTGDTKIVKGPIFSSVILIDEINRLNPKAQAALHQALAEGTVTIGNRSYKLTIPFLVLATQNPNTQKGTYELTEPLADRFMFELVMNETSDAEKIEIEKRTRDFQPEMLNPITDGQIINEVREFFYDKNNLYVSDLAIKHCVEIMNRINHPENFGLFNDELKLLEGGSLFRQTPPVNDRALLHLSGAAMMEAVWHRRAYVLPKDFNNIASDVLRARLALDDSSSHILLSERGKKYKNKYELVEYLLKELLNGVG